jgi:hypothetical protein
MLIIRSHQSIFRLNIEKLIDMQHFETISTVPSTLLRLYLFTGSGIMRKFGLHCYNVSDLHMTSVSETTNWYNRDH